MSRPRLSDARVLPTQYYQQRFGKRGGQNLTIRDLRLSRSTRQKQSFKDQPERFATTYALPVLRNGQQKRDSTAPALEAANTFMGVVVPQEPKPPESDECCMSGCAICVYDLYLSSLEKYREDLASIRVTLQEQNVPVSEWPAEIRMVNESSRLGANIELDVSLSAFAQLEKALREKNTG